MNNELSMMPEMMESRVAFDHTTILATATSTIENLIQDWDIDEPLGVSTRVVADLGFESIDLIQMVAALERAFALKRGVLVDLLVTEGRYVDDLTIGQIADGVAARIGQASGR